MPEKRSTHYKVLDDYLIIKLKAKEEKSAGGIILPAEYQEKERPRIGTILAIGDEVTEDKFKVGDEVLFKIWGGNLIKDPKNAEEELLIVLEEDILALVIED